MSGVNRILAPRICFVQRVSRANGVRVAPLALFFAAGAAAMRPVTADEPASADRLAPIVCMPSPIACEPRSLDRFDPRVQRLLVERDLRAQPRYWTTVYFYLPALDERELQELQIRYFEELLARARAKAEKLAVEE